MESQNKDDSKNNNGTWWNTDMSLISQVRVETQQTQPQTPKSDQKYKKWQPRDQPNYKDNSQSERRNSSQNTGSFQNKEQKKKQTENFETATDERTVTFAEEQETQAQTPKVYKPKQQTPSKSPSAPKTWKGKSPSKPQHNNNFQNQNQNRPRSKSFNNDNNEGNYNAVPYTYDNSVNKSQSPQPAQRKSKYSQQQEIAQSSPIPIGTRSAPPVSKKLKPKARSYEGSSSPIASKQSSDGSSPSTPQHTPNKSKHFGKSPRGVSSSSTPSKKSKDRFPPHWTIEEVNQALKEGRAYKGNLRVNPHNSSEAYVTTVAVIDESLGINQPALDKDVYIQGMIARNRAFDGDIIIVEILPKSKWKVLKSVAEEKVDDFVEDLLDEEVNVDKRAVLNEHATILDDEEAEEDSQESAQESLEALDKSFASLQVGSKGAEQTNAKTDQLDDEEELQPSGRVVFIMDSKKPVEFVGRVIPAKEDKVSADDRFAMFVPSDTRHPKMLVPIAQVPDFYKDHKIYEQTLVVVKLANWRSSSYFPLGKFDHILGQYGEIQAETEALLLANNIECQDFPQSIMGTLPSGNYVIPEDEIKRRRDLRKERIFTIDPITAKDLDDALSIKKLPDGNFQVGVHIADVSFFVQPGTELDSEAQKRSTSVYLVQKVIPMLPHILCENLCSLNPGVPRLAFSVMWTLSPSGDILDEWFGRTVISSCSKLSYDIAQLVIDGKLNSNWSDFKEVDLPQKYPLIGPVGPHTVQEMAQDIKYMWLIAKNLRDKRYENGALNMNNIKLSFKLDEHGNPVTAAPYITKEANHMIEEFMLLANMRVARKIASTFPEASLLRNHSPPLDRKLQGFQALCKKLGLPVDTSSAKSLGESLQELKTKLSPSVFAAFQVLATKPMQLAKYFCTGTLPPSQWHHFALNVGYYTHFTSPIRRYPDVVVHRQLEAAILLDNCLAENRIQDKALESCLSLLPEKVVLAQLCQHCNDKKLDSRRAQEQSDKLFLTLLLKTNILFDEAVILSLGDKFITAIVPFLGSEKRIYMEDINAHSWKYQADNNTLSISWVSHCDGSDLVSFPTTTKPNKSKSKSKTPESNDNQLVQKTFKVMDSLRVSMASVGSPAEVRVHIIHPSLWSQTVCPSFVAIPQTTTK